MEVVGCDSPTGSGTLIERRCRLHNNADAEITEGHFHDLLVLDW